MAEIKHKRKVATHNEYQKQIVLLSCLPAFFAFFSFLVVFLVGFSQLRDIYFNHSLIVWDDLVARLTWTIVLLLNGIFILTFVIAFKVSSNLVGAFGRIIFEMDEIIAKRSNQLIASRPSDTMSKELLKRVNVFIKSYVDKEDTK